MESNRSLVIAVTLTCEMISSMSAVDVRVLVEYEALLSTQ